MPNSTWLMMVLPPGEPMIIKPFGVSTNVGDMLDRLRLPGAMEFAVLPINPKALTWLSKYYIRVYSRIARLRGHMSRKFSRPVAACSGVLRSADSAFT